MNQEQLSRNKSSSKSREELKGTKFDLGRLEQLYKQRRDGIKEGCLSLNRTYTNEYISDRYQVYPTHNLLYCPIPKCGSTFWKATFQHINSGSVKSVKSLSGSQLATLKAYELSLLIVRDPYARLYSAYGNKIYHANLAFWRTEGSKAARLARNESAIFYGHDVKFPELVKYILHNFDKGIRNNLHFATMSSICDPCRHDFKYVATLETIKDDYDFILNKLSNEYGNFKIEKGDFVKEFARRTARNHLKYLYETKSFIQKIQFSFRKIMLRTWRDLQIRGFMSKSIPFPLDNEQAALNLTKDEFQTAINKGINATIDVQAAKKQRKEALIQAYRTVPMKDMERLSIYLANDCKLFGYDNRPKELFDRSTSLDTDFLYLDGL